MNDIDKLFFNYNYELILKNDADYFIEGILTLKCGNISIRKQMNSLKENIDRLLQIEKKYKSLDRFVKSDSPYAIAKLLAYDNTYKIKNMGIALALEYLRNVGINEIKPDMHIKRILSSQRLGICNSENPSEKETLEAIALIAERTGYSAAEIDAYLWLFCAKGYIEICGGVPKCHICSIKRFCHYLDII